MIPTPEDLKPEILKSLGRTSPRKFRPLRSELEKTFGLSTEERTMRTPADDEYLMSNHMHRALTSLVGEGYVEKLNRSDWQLTENGRKAVSEGL